LFHGCHFARVSKTDEEIYRKGFHDTVTSN
jgi:hypothetical protein